VLTVKELGGQESHERVRLANTGLAKNTKNGDIFNRGGKSVAQTSFDASSEGLHGIHTFLPNEGAGGILDKTTEIGLSTGPSGGVRGHPLLTGTRESGHDGRENRIIGRDDEITVGTG